MKDPVAAGEACVRLRSSRQTGIHNLPETPHCLFRTAAQPNAGFASCYKEWGIFTVCLEKQL
jgi:hypothetical protein